MSIWDELVPADAPTATQAPKTDWDKLVNPESSVVPAAEPIVPANLPPAPKWFNVIQPMQRREEQAKGVGEFVVAAAGRLDKSMAGLFNQLDFVQTSIGDALNQILVGRKNAVGIQEMRNKYGVTLDEVGGMSSINSIRPFKALADAINWAAAPAKELPNTLVGGIVGGIADIGPQIIAAAVAPEVSALKVWGMNGKFAASLGIQGFVGGMQDAQGGSALQKLTTPVLKGIEQGTLGAVYEMMGPMSSKLGGKFANKFIPEVKTASQLNSKMLIGGTATTSFNALMFGGYGTLSEFLEKGESSWKSFGTNVGIGFGLGAKEVGKGLWAKGMSTFVAAEPELIMRIAKSDVSSEELIIKAQQDAKAAETEGTPNPEGKASAALLGVNTGLLKAMVEEIRDNPQDVIKSVEESSMDQPIKDLIIDKIDQIQTDNNPAIQEAKPLNDKITAIDQQLEILNNSPRTGTTDKEIISKSLAAKREKLVQSVIKIHDKYAQKTAEEQGVIDNKAKEDLKQSRLAELKAAEMLPNFTTQGETLANEFGGKFIARVKPPESTVAKTTRTNTEVSQVTDILGGAVIVPDMKNFKEVSKKLKAEGYSLSNKRVGNKETGRRGVLATKTENGIGQEIQIHTPQTWEIQQKVDALQSKWKAGPPSIAEPIPPSPTYVAPKAVFPEGFTSEVKIRKSGNDRIEVIDDKTDAVVSSFALKTKDVEGEIYWEGGSLQTHEDYQGKGLGQNAIKQAMANLPEGYKGLYFPEGTIQNDAEIPHIFEKLGKEYDVTTAENGDVFIKLKGGNAYDAVDQVNAHNEGGGSTFNLSGKNLAGSKGKGSVGIFPERTETIKGEVTPEILNKFVETNKDILKGNEDIFSIGTWKDTEAGDNVLDIVATPSLEKAIELGKKYDQKAIFDLGDMKDVSTGGTGGSEAFKNIPIEQRAAEVRSSLRDQYEADMAESRRLYEEAYKGLENVDLEGSRAKTPLERKMKAMEIPVATQKELNKAWTATKRSMLEGIKDANRDIKAEFKQFVKDMPLTGLGIPLKKAMLNKVNAIDFTKPKSLDRAIAYFDKVISDATFRYETIATMKALDGLDQRTSESFLSKKATNGLLKNKIGPSGLPLWDELKVIRKDMETGDWKQGQEEIQKIFDKYMNEDAPAFSIEDYNKIVRENFKGLLNETNGANKGAIEGALRDLKDIIKNGKSQAVAKAIADRAVQAEFNAYAVKALTANGLKPVKTDVLEKANVTEGRFDHILTWFKTSNWDSLMDIFSKFDSDKYMGKGQGTIPWNSRLSVEMRNVVKDASKNQYHTKLQVMNEVQSKFRESLGASNDRALKKLEHDNSTVKHVITYKNILGVDKSLEMTRNQALKVWMEIQDPSLQKSNEAPSELHDAYMRGGELTDLGKKVEDLLTPGLKKWGQWQLDEFYPNYWPRINEVYRRKFGVDMPLNEKYSPIFVAEKFIEGGVGDDIILSRQNALSTATNASLKARVSHGKKLALMDANKVLINYIDKMEFFINWTDALDFVNNTFVKDGNIREAIKQNFGRNALSAVEATIKDFGQAPRDSRYAAGWINTLRNNLTIASLALKPNVFFSQLTSQPAYIDKIGAFNYVKNNPFNDWKGTKTAFNNIKNSDYWKMRYGEGGGWDWTVMEAMKKDVNSIGGRSDWQTLKNQSMFLTKYGDMVSVVTGGIPVYKHFYNKILKETGNKALAHNIAMNEFSDITDKSQQASQVYDLSQVQRDPILKMATMYRTAPMQYHRNVIAAFRNGVLPTSGQRGTSFNNLKTIAIYHVLLPSLYQFAANGFQFDKKEQIRAAVLGNFGDIFIAGDVIEGVLNSVRGLPWDYQFSPLEQIVANAKKSAVHASAFAKQLNEAVEGVTYDELGKAAWDAARVLGDVSGTPVAAVQSKITAIKDVVEGNTDHPVGRIIGWSEAVMSGNMNDLTDSETMMNIEKFKKGILPPQPIPGPVKSKSKEIPKNKRIPEF